MRPGLAAFTILLAAGLRLEAHASPLPPQDSTARAGSVGAAQAQRAAPNASGAVRARLQRLARDPEGIRIAADSLSVGDRTIAPGSTVPGPVAIERGTLVIDGTVAGDAVSIGGDVVVREGGHVLGDALSVGGTVRLEGGRVEGEMRALSDIVDPVAAAAAATRSPLAATWRALGLAIGWLTLLVALGIGVLASAGRYLEDVAEALERRFFRAFLVGVAGQLGIIPVLVIGCVLLALTLIGILLIPFAIVAYMLAIAGIATLGFLAVARVTGSALSRRDEGGTPRSRALRALILGIACYLGLWVLAAAFSWSPWAAAALRGLAAVVTWVAVTTGFGAAILSRLQRRVPVAAAAAAPAMDDFSWQTPTPITGVVAARRPTPMGNPRMKEPL